MVRILMEDRLLTIDQVIERTQLSRRNLYNIWARGEGPKTVKVGHRRLVRESDLRAWMETLGGHGTRKDD